MTLNMEKLWAYSFFFSFVGGTRHGVHKDHGIRTHNTRYKGEHEKKRRSIVGEEGAADISEDENDESDVTLENFDDETSVPTKVPNAHHQHSRVHLGGRVPSHA